MAGGTGFQGYRMARGNSGKNEEGIGSRVLSDRQLQWPVRKEGPSEGAEC